MIRRQFLGLLFVFLFLAPAWSVMYAQVGGGKHHRFFMETQSTRHVSSGQHSPIGFGLTLKHDDYIGFLLCQASHYMGSSPVLAVHIDANADGVSEWAFNDTGYGGFRSPNRVFQREFYGDPPYQSKSMPFQSIPHRFTSPRERPPPVHRLRSASHPC